MSQSNQFVCPSCDAPLTAEPGQTEVTCKFCGTTVIVPPELRTPLPGAAPDRAAPSFTPPPAPPIFIIQPPPTQQPQMVYTTPTPQWGPQRRPSRGCGCGCGCWAALLGLLCAAVALIATLGMQNPAVLSSAFSILETRAPQVDAAFAQLPPTIVIFDASAKTVSGITPVTLTWVASGQTVTLEHLDPRNNISQRVPVPAFGRQLLFLGAPSGRTVTFRLTASGQGSTEHQDISIYVR